MDPRLIVALDFEDVNQAEKLVKQLGDQVSYYKVGLELLAAGGLDFASELMYYHGKNVFMDWKFHDIANTVERATRQVAKRGFNMVTVHSKPNILKAAVKGAEGTDLKVIGVSRLTDLPLDEAEFYTIQHVINAAHHARDAGAAGVVCSPLEAHAVRMEVADDFLIVTPGVRLDNEPTDDQIRIASPKFALEQGSDFLVLGRPITRAPDPVLAVQAILSQMEYRREPYPRRPII